MVACRNKYPDSDTMTKLSAIDGHVIYLYCRCGHSAGLPVADLFKTLLQTTTVSQVAQAARCKGCGALLMAWMPPPDGITMCQFDEC